MVIGYTSKYCHFCGKETNHQGQQNKEFIVWVCQNPQHQIARLLTEKD